MRKDARFRCFVTLRGEDRKGGKGEGCSWALAHCLAFPVLSLQENEGGTKGKKKKKLKKKKGKKKKGVFIEGAQAIPMNSIRI